MSQDIADKLRLTALALGCTSRKEFAARFREANPNTHCDIERLHKWMQGRAQPRAPQFYEDWAKVIGTRHSGAWLLASPMAGFIAELTAATGTHPDTLARLDRAGPRSPATARAPSGHRLAGGYACYSHAWSPHFQGRLIRGSLRLASAADRLRGEYRENVPRAQLHLTGHAIPNGNGLMLVMTDAAQACTLCFSLFAPGPPASVLCGIMTGMSLLAQDQRPMAGRILLVRLPDSIAPEDANRYIDAGAAPILADLAACGVRPADTVAFAALIDAYLSDDRIAVDVASQRAFAAQLDPWLLAGLPAPSDPFVA